MFKWLQNQIRKSKGSQGSSQQVELAKEATCDGSSIPQQKSECPERSSFPDLSRYELPDQKQDFGGSGGGLTLFRERQEAEEECPQGIDEHHARHHLLSLHAPVEDLLHDPHRNQSFMTRGEGTLPGVHCHYPQQHSIGASSIQDTGTCSIHKRITGSATSQTHDESPSSLHFQRKSLSNPSTFRLNTSSPPDRSESMTATLQEHGVCVFSTPKHTKDSSSPQEDRENPSRPEEYQDNVMDPQHMENRCSKQGCKTSTFRVKEHASVSSQLEHTESVSCIQRHVKSTSSPQEQKENTSYRQEHIENTSSPQEQKVSTSYPQEHIEITSSPQEQKESTSYRQEYIESTSSPQEQKESTFYQQEHIESTSSPQEQKESTSYQQEHIESTSSPQEQKESISYPQEHIESTSSPQEQKESTSYQQEHIESASSIQKQKESTSYPQEHTENTSKSQEQKESTSSPQEHKESTSSPQELIESASSPQEVIESTSSPQELIESASSPQELIESTPSPQEVIESTSSPQDLIESTSSSQEVIESISSPQELIESVSSLQKLIESTPSPQEVIESISSSQELVGSTSSSQEVIESISSPQELIESVSSSQELIESTPSPQEVIESISSPQELIESASGPQELIESTPSPQELIESTSSPQELIESTSSSQEVIESISSPQELIESVSSPQKLIETTPSPQELIESTSSPQEQKQSTSYPQEHIESTSSPQEQKESTSSPQEHKESTFYPQEHTENASSPQELIESSSSPQEHKESTSSPQELIESTFSPQELTECASGKQELIESTSSPQELIESTSSPQELIESTSSLQELIESTSNPQELIESTSSPQELVESTPSPQELIKSTSSPQELIESTSSSQELIESTSSSQEVIESTSNSQEVTENTSNSQEHIEIPSSPQEHIESTSSSQEHKGSTSSPQEHKKSTSSPQEHIESTSSSQEHKESTSSSQEHTESTSSPQKHIRSPSSTQEPDTCQYSSSPLYIVSNTHNMPVVEERSWSSPSLTSAMSQTSAKSKRNPTFCSIISYTNQDSQNSGNDVKDNQEQENNVFPKTERDFTQEAKPSQRSGHCVVGRDSVHLQERNASEVVEENDHGGDRLASEVMSKSVIHVTKSGTSNHVCEPLSSVSLERVVSVDDTSLIRMGKSAETMVVKVNSYTQTPNAEYNSSNPCSNLCCLHQACLYNQKGRKVTVLGELFILTYVKESPVLVSTAIENRDVNSMGCLVVWSSGKTIEFRDLPDGTEVYFDAIVPLQTSTFAAMVIWQDTKPSCSIEPYYNCYVIVDLIRNCPLKFVSFGKENGIVSVHINGKMTNVMFSKSVVYVDGQKIQNINEMKKLFSSTSKQLYGDVLKLVTLDPAGKVVYGFMCSCIWLGFKPLLLDIPTVYDPLKLYRKAVGYFAVASKQSLLLCDVDALLEVKNTSYKILFDHEGQPVELTCDKMKIFSGYQRVQLPVSGKVKVHLRKQSHRGTCTWVPLMVQVQPPPQSLSADAAASCTQSQETKEAVACPSLPVAAPVTGGLPPATPTKGSLKSAASSDGIELDQVTSGTESDAVMKSQCTPARKESGGGVERKSMKPVCEKVAFTTSVAQSLCSSEVSYRNTVEEESQIPSLGAKEHTGLLFHGQPAHSNKVVSHSDPPASLKIIKNCSGVLKNVGETFIIEAQLEGELVHIEMKKVPWIVYDNGVGRRCQTPMADIPVWFDARYADSPLVGPTGHILALWSGKKPAKASLGGSIYYYDAPGVYHGTDENECFRFMVMLEGRLSFITTTSTTAIFEATGERCASLATLSHVFLHLSPSQDVWTLYLVVHQPKCRQTHLIQEENCWVSPKSLSMPDLNTIKGCVKKSQTKTKNLKTPLGTLESSQASEELARYLKNLCGTLVEEAGERLILTHHKNIKLSVEVRWNCTVDVNNVSLNAQDILIGTKLHLDAFCDSPKSSRYWAVLMWLEKKPRKSVSHSGHTFYYGVQGRCLSSSDKEVSLEIFLENKTEHVVCKAGHVIMPDGTSRDLGDLTVGTAIQANLLQHNEKLSVNDFIYIATAAAVAAPPAAQSSHPAKLLERKSERGGTAGSKVTKETSKEISGKVELPNVLAKDLNSAEAKLETLCSESSTTDKSEVVVNHNSIILGCEYAIARGKISQPKQNAFIFTDETQNLKVNMSPLEIALDLHLSPSSLTREFHLVYHRKTRAGVCGWYQPRPCQVYFQLGMIVHTHSLASRILTLLLPDRTSLYNFLFDCEILVTGNKVCRQQELKSGLRVHPIIEDINPHYIGGCVVSHRIAFITTVKGLAVTCVNFLKHSLTDSEKIKVPSKGQPLCPLGSMTHSLPKDGNPPLCTNSSDKGHSRDEGKAPLHTVMTTNTLLKQQLHVKPINESSSECLEFISTSEGHLCSEISITQSQVNQLFDKNHTGDIPAVDGEGDVLRKLIFTKHPRIVHKTHVIRYVTLYGEIQPGSSGAHMFSSNKLHSPIQLPAKLPHLDDVCESRVKGFVLARKVYARETGLVEHRPLVVWPEGRRCDPYIVVSYEFVWKRSLLLITDAANGSEKWYLNDYNSLFSLKNTYNINEVTKSYSKQGKKLVLYAVVENIPLLQIEGHYVEGNVLLLTTSKNVAVASIDIFIGSCHEEDLLFQMQDNYIFQLLHLHKVMMDRAMRCGRGTTCYFPSRETDSVSSFRSVGGYLEAHTDDFAIIKCNKGRTTAVCHFSSIYYQGLNITSWETIPEHLWKNFWAIILPLDEAVMEAKWEVDAVALVSWCCRGPHVLAMHQCYYHVPTLYVPHLGAEESQQAAPASPSESVGNASYGLPLESCAGAVMSLAELESWQCLAGSTIFAFHESLLRCCDLLKASGKIILVKGLDVLFSSADNEVVKCKISDVFVRGKRCQSTREVASEADKTFTFLGQRCSPTLCSGKIVSMEGVIAFVGSLKPSGIHVCNKHACILDSSLHKEEFAMAEEAFNDIAVLCEQSTQCSDYYLSKMTASGVETPVLLPDVPTTRTPTLCCGVVVELDKEQVRVKVSLPQESGFLILPVCHSRLMCLHKDLPLQHAVGRPLKVILDSAMTDDREIRILTAWGNFSQESAVVANSTSEHERLSTQRASKPHCCTQALEVRQFQSLYNRDMFELKSLYKLKNVDEDAGKGFFHYWLNKRLVTCRIESIVGWPKVNRTQEQLWNLLVPRAYRAGECPEAVAAWQEDSDSLVVDVCDVHGTHGLNFPFKDEGKAGDKSSFPSLARRERCKSESQEIGLSAGNTLRQHARNRHNSEPLNMSLPAGFNLRPTHTIQEDYLLFSRSWPSEISNSFGSELNEMNGGNNEYLQHSYDSTSLLSLGGGSLAEGRKIELTPDAVSLHHNGHHLRTSSVCDDNNEDQMNLESERDLNSSILRCTLTTIKSSSFLCIDSHRGLLLDSTAHIVAMVRQGKLYINKVKPKEFCSLSNEESITAVVVPLASYETLANLRVTHEAVVAWRGSRPAGVGSVVKNINITLLQSKNLLQGKTKLKERHPEHEGTSRDPGMSCSMVYGARKPHRSSMWAARPTLRIIHGRCEAVSGCCVGGYTDHCGILTSARGPILFDRKLEVEAAPGAPQSGQEGKNLKALVLELEQPVEILDCEVKKVAVVLWNGAEPVVDDSFINRSLETYKMNWIVVVIRNLSAMTKPDKSVSHSFYETSDSDYETSHSPEIVFYCSQESSVRQHKVVLVLSGHVVLKNQDSLVLALRDDVKCDKNQLEEGKNLQVIAVKVVEPFNYCVHLITHFALLVCAGGMEPPEAVNIMSDWSRGKIEKVTSVERKVICGPEKVNIRIKSDRLAHARPLPLDLPWPCTADRPEGDMIFAVECEVCKLMRDCGILKAKGRTLGGSGVKLFFMRGVVLINDEELTGNDSLAVQMSPVQSQLWRCTGQRLTPQERQGVEERTGEEAQYKALVVWCKICPSALSTLDIENKDQTKPSPSTPLAAEAPAESGAANTRIAPLLDPLARGQVEAVGGGMKDLCAIDTPLTTDFLSKETHKSKATEDPRNSWSHQQNNTKVGCVTEVHRTIAQLSLEGEQLQYVARDRCFLYGVCLGKVELWHVLSIGLAINYELTEDGKELKGAWVGGMDLLEPSLQLDTLQQWCLIHNVTPSATTALLIEAGWLPSELTPTAAPGENKDVVDVAASGRAS